MKHGQACAIARAVDVAGERWSLLLVRELSLGPRPALPAGQACELRVGPEVFYLGSDAGKLTVRRGPAPDGDAVITRRAGTTAVNGRDANDRRRDPATTPAPAAAGARDALPRR